MQVETPTRIFPPQCSDSHWGVSISQILQVFNPYCTYFDSIVATLLPWEVIIFGIFYRLFCCLDHMIQSFSMTLCSVILWSFPMFGFLSWSSHGVHQCLLIQISLAVLGRQPFGPVMGLLDGQRSSPSCSCPSFVGHESLWGFIPDSSFLVWWVCDWPSREQLVSACPWYSGQQNRSDVWEFWIVHWIYISIKWLKFWRYSDI